MVRCDATTFKVNRCRFYSQSIIFFIFFPVANRFEGLYRSKVLYRRFASLQSFPVPTPLPCDVTMRVRAEQGGFSEREATAPMTTDCTDRTDRPPKPEGAAAAEAEVVCCSGTLRLCKVCFGVVMFH